MHIWQSVWVSLKVWWRQRGGDCITQQHGQRPSWDPLLPHPVLWVQGPHLSYPSPHIVLLDSVGNSLTQGTMFPRPLPLRGCGCELPTSEAVRAQGAPGEAVAITRGRWTWGRGVGGRQTQGSSQLVLAFLHRAHLRLGLLGSSDVRPTSRCLAVNPRRRRPRTPIDSASAPFKGPLLSWTH